MPSLRDNSKVFIWDYYMPSGSYHLAILHNQVVAVGSDFSDMCYLLKINGNKQKDKI